MGPPATVAFKYVLFPCILGENDLNLTNPRCSMYGYLPTYIYHTFKPNVGKYTIHSAHMGIIYYRYTRWWFQIFFMFNPTWGRFPFGLKPPSSTGIILFAWLIETPIG